MRCNRILLATISVLLSTFIFCEYIIYFVVLSQCSWPQLRKNSIKESVINEEEELKVVFIADTHLLGIRKGHWFDKLRREWQMYRSFQTLLKLHEPEIVFILGDIYDEASFSPDDVYMKYVERFLELFSVDKNKELFVVAGNHDVGFHYAMHPYLEYRFSQTMNAPSVRLISRKNNHFVLLNSMALEKDGCSICRKAEEQIRSLSNTFCCANGTLKCSKQTQIDKYSRPILLMHFPLYRRNDANCSGWDVTSYQEKFTRFKENWHSLSKKSTKDILQKLHPRVVFTGHTHHGCHTLHNLDINEFTVPSFNWRNKPNPAFIMATFNLHNFAVHRCFLPHEYFVLLLYFAASVTSLGIIYPCLIPNIRRRRYLRFWQRYCSFSSILRSMRFLVIKMLWLIRFVAPKPQADNR